MMILACRGLGDVMIPADTVQICNKWSTVPSNRAYLTASIRLHASLTSERGWWPMHESNRSSILAPYRGKLA